MTEDKTMNIIQLLSASARDVLSAPSWMAAQFFGDVALAAALYGWLSLPDRTGWQVAASVLLFILLLAFVVVLNAATFAALRRRVQTGSRKPMKEVLSSLRDVDAADTWHHRADFHFRAARIRPPAPGPRRTLRLSPVPSAADWP